MIILCQTDNYYFFLSCNNLVFYSIQHVSYWMAMMTSVFTSSWHILYLLLFSGGTSWFYIGGYGYFCTYVVLSHFQHNGSPYFVTNYYIRKWFFFPVYFSFYFMLYLTISTFTTCSLVDVSPIYKVSMCFQPIITARNSTNRYPCKYFVKKSTSKCSVLQYLISMLLLSNQFFVEKYHISMCLEFPVHDFFPLFSILLYFLSCNNMLCLMSYSWYYINKHIQILYGS